MKNIILTILVLLVSLTSVAQAAEASTYRARLSITNTNKDGSVLTVFRTIDFKDNVPVYITETKRPVAVMFTKNVSGETVGTFYDVGPKQKLIERYVFNPNRSEIYLFPDVGISIQLYFGKAYDSNRPVTNHTSI